MRATVSGIGAAVILALAGCGAKPVAQSEGHIVTEPARVASSIPEPVRAIPLPPAPEAKEAELRYSVVVANQPVREVLQAMARETKVNFDIHPGIEGNVNLNAIDQTLRQILTRIAKQVDMRWEAEGSTITVMPDTPYLRNYRIDYVNMSRDVAGTIGVESNVVTPPSAQTTGSTTTTSSGSTNSSLLKVTNQSRNRFWETLEKNLKDLLRETDKLLPEGSSETFVSNRGQGGSSSNRPTLPPRTAARSASAARTGPTMEGPGDTSSTQQSESVESRLTFREAASVIVNPEAGVVTVRATSRQHEKVAEFLSQIQASAKRQVLIEATVVEVLLSDNYQAGVDWSALGLQGLGYSFRQSMLGTNLNTSPFFSVDYNNPNAARGGSISSTVKVLETFGKTRVLSSPKIMAVNNQTAVLKVVDNQVYFTVQAQVTPSQGNANPIVVYTTTQNVVPVGFVMNVTPQIADNDVVVLNVRPTVSRVVGSVLDPNPDLKKAGVENKVPVIQSREFESVLRIPSGNTAILGGLMEDRFEGNRDGIPIVSRVPFLGDLVSYRNDTSRKSELVIFLRPIVVRDPSLEGDLAAYRRFAPDETFFKDTHPPAPHLQQQIDRLENGQWPQPTPQPVVPEPPKPGAAS